MKAVIVTGAAGGIGKATVKTCVEKGYTTFSGAIDDWEMSELTKLKYELGNDEKLIPVMLDLRNPDQIDAVVEKVTDSDPGFLAIVTNGAACPSAIPFEHLDINDTTRDVFETNVFGNLRLIQKALPMLKKTRGRVVHVSSLFGKTGDGMLLSYASSKHAGEAFCTVLRRELKPFGIKFIITNPGLVQRTYMAANHHVTAKKVLAKMVSCSPKTISSQVFYSGENSNLKQPKLIADKQYWGNYKGLLKNISSGLSKSIFATPEVCAAHILKGMESPKPRIRYISGIDAKLLLFITRYFPESWTDKLATSLSTEVHGADIAYLND